MHSYSKDWQKCSRCGTLSNDVKDGVCTDEERCARFAAKRADREFELRVAEFRKKNPGATDNG